MYRVLMDHLGSVRAVVDVSSGEVAQRLEYDEFGVVLVDTNPGFQPFGFAGGLYDADTGLVRFGARDYDAVTGRTAKDPILFRGRSTNLYAYVGNDPGNRVDPSGLKVVAQDPLAQELIYSLANTWGGEALLSYLDASPIEYPVSTNFTDEQGVGQFGKLAGELCSDTLVRVNSESLTPEEMVFNLGHELGHAALYNEQRIPFGGNLPDFLNPSMGVPGDPGGMSMTAHADWTYTAPYLFGSGW
jgi:RHS repeat-associated protein